MSSENKPIQIEANEWWYKGCFIQEFEHPSLDGKYEVFKDTELQEHVGRSKTFEGAVALCEINEVTDYKLGYKQFITLTDPMKEPLVSKDQAFLMKAMGYNEVTARFYQIQSDKTIRLFPASLEYNHNEYSNEVAVPTHGQAIRWLREIKKMHCSVVMFTGMEKWYPLILNITTKAYGTTPDQSDIIYFDTYDEAMVVAIDYTLKMLTEKFGS